MKLIIYGPNVIDGRVYLCDLIHASLDARKLVKQPTHI